MSGYSSGYQDAYHHGNGDHQLHARPRSRRPFSRISWGSVIAGAIITAASFILLNLLGVALGAGGMRFTQGTDFGNYGLGAGIWSALSLLLSMAFGGYVAARLSGTHSHLDAELHGITVWALSLLMMTLLAAQLISSLIGTAATTAGSAIGGAAGGSEAGAGAAAGAAASLAGAVTGNAGPAGLVDRLQQTLTTAGDPTQMSRQQISAEIASLTGRRVVNGTLTNQERERLSTLVAAEAGVGRDEAGRRIAMMEHDASEAVTQAEQQARSAAERAARAAAVSARALFSGLLLSLAGALVGAWLGTRHARVLHPHPEHDWDDTTHHVSTVHHTYEPTHVATHPVTTTTVTPAHTTGTTVYAGTHTAAPQHTEVVR